MLAIKVNNLSASIAEKKILNKVSFSAKKGDVIAVVGPNGTGKSTLLKSIMNHFNVKITNGSINFAGKNLKGLSTDKIAKMGVFYATQNPTELEGIKTLEFLKIIVNESSKEKVGFYQLYSKINDLIKQLDLPAEILTRNVNVGFSGGQKKKNEILQAQLFNPSLLLLDEIDSGLDIDAIEIISDFINKNRKDRITIVVSHHLDFLYTLKPNKVIVLIDGFVTKIGDISLVKTIEKNGYKQFTSKIKNKPDFEITDPYLACHRK
ncbi:MAG: Fe-S cluster assembly ATPase SufC [Mycoplasmataceae bacterium]|jgi:Fe-S cluster assembly ATP-binding protein|nr:Fe-S cluster assembly ATPase SufC [Mycoplasmataceae bacterium]